MSLPNKRKNNNYVCEYLFFSAVEELCEKAGLGGSGVRAGCRGRGRTRAAIGLGICRGRKKHKHYKRLVGEVV